MININVHGDILWENKLGNNYSNYFGYDVGFTDGNYYILGSKDELSDSSKLCVLKISKSYIYNDNAVLENYDSLRIYPNPASEKLYVEAVSAKEKYRFIEIADISGRLMLRGELSFEYEKNVEIDINHLEGGVYIIRIVSETQSVFKKFVKLNRFC